MPIPSDALAAVTEYLRREAPMELARLRSVGRLAGSEADGRGPVRVASCGDG